MPVLVLTIAVCLVFAVILVPVWMAGTVRSHPVYQARTSALEERQGPPSITQAFDPVYAVLWEARIAALRIMGPADTLGISAGRLCPIFNQAPTLCGLLAKELRRLAG